MFGVNGLYALLLCGVLAYVLLRDPPRLLLTPLMLLSFWLLYGVGHFVFYSRADAVARVQEQVTYSLVLMWIALVLGAELARTFLGRRSSRASAVVAGWNDVPMRDSPTSDGLLVAAALLMAGYVLTVFLAVGKPAQMLAYLHVESALDKQKYRLEFAGQGGYLYQTLLASIGPFMSFLLLVKGWTLKKREMLWAGAALAACVLAGKLATFHKVPWLVYLLQLAVVFQAAKRLDLNLGRAIGLAVFALAGASAAAVIALPELDALGILEWVGYRFFEVNNEVVYQTFYVYPEYIPHTNGMNIGLIQRIFGEGELVSAHTHVANFFGAFGATFDPFYIGDAWVDFGYAGVFFTSLLVGLLVKTLDIVALQAGKAPLTVALLGSGLYGLFQLQVTSAFTAFLSGGLLLIPLMTVAASGVTTALARSMHPPPRVSLSS